MAVDPTDPETFEDDERPEEPELDVEAPAADTAEQRADLAPEQDDPRAGGERGRTREADEADVAEQRRVVSHHEDDYR
ncbi:hypothetical protein [Streptomyces sp. SID8352]|uniref:hypothetical protein n=1 Tax=Streptomyces sp. SID8352 TaxID=2690338 RepID=UPI001368A048|nr:hypothetical protein [Streptomyces sp. SID8352]MYU23615.1 hypothetical protein [Streptomyces sp. SID8352]